MAPQGPHARTHTDTNTPAQQARERGLDMAQCVLAESLPPCSWTAHQLHDDHKLVDEVLQTAVEKLHSRVLNLRVWLRRGVASE